nr:exocyst complex component sec15b [Quercus suber]
MALKCLDSIETELLDKTPSSPLRRMLEKKIPEIRAHIERLVSKEFGDWLVEIRVVSRNLGQLAIGQASSARQREKDLRIKQRQAEEQSRLSLYDCVYALQDEDEDEDDQHDQHDAVGLSNGLGNDGYGGGFDLTPLYRASQFF